MNASFRILPFLFSFAAACGPSHATDMSGVKDASGQSQGGPLPSSADQDPRKKAIVDEFMAVVLASNPPASIVDEAHACLVTACDCELAACAESADCRASADCIKIEDPTAEQSCFQGHDTSQLIKLGTCFSNCLEKTGPTCQGIPALNGSGGSSGTSSTPPPPPSTPEPPAPHCWPGPQAVGDTVWANAFALSGQIDCQQDQPCTIFEVSLMADGTFTFGALSTHAFISEAPQISEVVLGRWSLDCNQLKLESRCSAQTKIATWDDSLSTLTLDGFMLSNQNQKPPTLNWGDQCFLSTW